MNEGFSWIPEFGIKHDSNNLTQALNACLQLQGFMRKIDSIQINFILIH